jgi:adenylate kinase family enzyme
LRIEKISLRGPGVIILTGPSSCGKGEVALALRRVMSIPPEHHLSMGEILRTTIERSKQDESFRLLLENKYNISNKTNIFSCLDSSPDLSKKVLSHVPAMEEYFKKKDMGEFTSQLDWLEFCTMNGFLVPNRWTQEFIAAQIEHNREFQSRPFILDGYPRRPEAAKHLLEMLRKLHIPVIKVLHLSISKQEMISRAGKRARADDDEASLLSRYNFYIESVQPTVDYLKMELGSSAIALIDAHQPVYKDVDGKRLFDLAESINNVVISVLLNLGVPGIAVRDIIQQG